MYAVSKTDIGRMRSTNQDVCCCGAFEDGSAWTVVCDGMGGVNGGNIASSIASETIVQCLQDAYAPGMDADAMRDMMLSAVQSANDAVIRRAEAEAGSVRHGHDGRRRDRRGRRAAHRPRGRQPLLPENGARHQAGHDGPFLCAAACGERRDHRWTRRASTRSAT